jgi:hypothetical protein
LVAIEIVSFLTRPALGREEAGSVAPIYSGLDGDVNKILLALHLGKIIPLAIIWFWRA